MKINTFSLPAGKTCPGAEACRSMVVLDNGDRKIKDGARCEFRCFAASDEARYAETYKQRKRNLDALRQKKSKTGMFSILDNAVNKMESPLSFGKGNNKLNKNKKIKEDTTRVHVSGDFYSQSYFDAWVEVARNNPKKRFYAYTKSLHFWAEYLPETRSKTPVCGVPGVPNLILTASVGGKYDDLIEKHNLRFAKVVKTKYQARKLKLAIDKDDSKAMNVGKSFALLLHGVQPAKA